MPARDTCAFVISDLHLGGNASPMMSCPERLAGFIERLAASRAEDADIELVIAGDFVDFLAIEPHACWTPDAREALAKLERTMRAPPFDCVFTALGKLVGAGHGLTILVGNHDVELALPPVQDALLAHLQASPRQVRFVDDGRAYRIGRALIEHGNRYDGANVNDWTGLRAIVSALSRHETPPVTLEVSAGSRLVEAVINSLKARYPFIDLLQPQGELVALLLLAFEPGLIWHIDKLARLLHARRRQDSNAQGAQPSETRNVARTAADIAADIAAHDAELARAFGDSYTTLVTPPSTSAVGALDLLRIAWQSRADSLADILDRGELIPAERLEQIRVVLDRMLANDRSALADGPTEQYGKAAERMIAESHGDIEVVVMGHTHLARHIGEPERARYINTGTWADVIRVPDEALEPGADEALTAFLAALVRDERPRIPRPYAELCVQADGAVRTARLAWEASGDDA